MNLIIANIFSFIGMTLFIISSFMNTKKKMLYTQGADALFNGIACFMRGSYSGMAVNFIGSARNVLTAKGISPKWFTGLICVSLVVIGTIFNDKGLIGYLPIIASVEYTIYMALTDDIKHIRIALMINVSLWAIHDFYMLLIPSASINTFVLITTLIKITKERVHHEQRNISNKARSV